MKQAAQRAAPYASIFGTRSRSGTIVTVRGRADVTASTSNLTLLYAMPGPEMLTAGRPSIAPISCAVPPPATPWASIHGFVSPEGFGTRCIRTHWNHIHCSLQIFLCDAPSECPTNTHRLLLHIAAVAASASSISAIAPGDPPDGMRGRTDDDRTLITKRRICVPRNTAIVIRKFPQGVPYPMRGQSARTGARRRSVDGTKVPTICA